MLTKYRLTEDNTGYTGNNLELLNAKLSVEVRDQTRWDGALLIEQGNRERLEEVAEQLAEEAE